MAVVRQQPNVWGQVAPAAAGFLGKLTGAYQRSAALKELDAYTRSAEAHEAEPMAFASTVIEIAQKYGMTPGPVVQQLLAIKQKDWEAKGGAAFAEQLFPKRPTAEFARASEEAGFTPTGAEGPPTQEATSPWAAAARTGRLTIPQVMDLWNEERQANRMAREDERLERRDRFDRHRARIENERLLAKDLWDRQKEQEKAAQEEQERKASAGMFLAMSRDAISPEQFVTSAAQPFTPLDTVRAQGEAFRQASDDLAGIGDAAYEAIAVSGKPAYDAAKAFLDERRAQAEDEQKLRRERERESAPKWSESRGAFVAPGRAAEVPEGLPEKPEGAPTTRTRHVGDTEITEEWRNGAWTRIGTAPRYRPTNPEAGARLERREESALRKEFNSLPEVKAFKESYTSAQQAISALAMPNLPKDIALSYKFNKLLDPDSVVREGEFERLFQSQSFANRLRGGIEKIVSGGGGLTDDERRTVKDAIVAFTKDQMMLYNRARKDFVGYASDYGFDPSRIVGSEIPFDGRGRDETPPRTSTAQTPTTQTTPARKAEYKDFTEAWQSIHRNFKNNPAERSRRLKMLEDRARTDGVIK